MATGESLEKSRIIEQVKQLTYEEIKEHSLTSYEQKQIKLLNRIADDVALRISEYMNGGEYRHSYYVGKCLVNPKTLEEHLNSVFNVEFRVEFFDGNLYYLAPPLPPRYYIRFKADVSKPKGWKAWFQRKNK